MRTGAASKQLLGCGVEVRTELSEGRHFAILGELTLDLAGNLLHRLRLADEPTRDTERPTFTPDGYPDRRGPFRGRSGRR